MNSHTRTPHAVCGLNARQAGSDDCTEGMDRRVCLQRIPLWLTAPAMILGQDAQATTVQGVTPTTLTIGQTAGLDGGKNDYAAATLDGVHASLNGANATGGVHGRKVLLKTLDDRNQASLAAANAEQLLKGDDVFVLFGPIEGGPSTAVAEVAAKQGVPLFGPIAGSPGLRRPHQPLVFPVRAEHREEFRALLRYARERGQRKVGFLHADTPVGAAHLENVRRLCAAIGMELVCALALPPTLDDTGLATMVKRLATEAPDIFFNHGSAAAYEKLIRAARSAGLRTTFMGINSGSSQLATHLGPLAEGMVFTQVVPSPHERKTEATRDYQASFRAAWPDKPFSYGSLEGWLTAQALLAALKLAGRQPTRASFIAGLRNVTLTVSGLSIRYAPGEHTGMTFVDLSMYSRDRRFIH